MQGKLEHKNEVAVVADADEALDYIHRRGEYSDVDLISFSSISTFGREWRGYPRRTRRTTPVASNPRTGVHFIRRGPGHREVVQTRCKRLSSTSDYYRGVRGIRSAHRGFLAEDRASPTEVGLNAPMMNGRRANWFNQMVQHCRMQPHPLFRRYRLTPKPLNQLTRSYKKYSSRRLYLPCQSIHPQAASLRPVALAEPFLTLRY